MPRDAATLAEIGTNTTPGAPRRRPGKPRGYGKPPGSGRQRGTPNKSAVELLRMVAARGTPVQFVVDVASGKRVKIAQGDNRRAHLVYPSMAERLRASEVLIGKISPSLAAARVDLTGGDAGDAAPITDRTLHDLARRIAFTLLMAAPTVARPNGHDHTPSPQPDAPAREPAAFDDFRRRHGLPCRATRRCASRTASACTAGHGRGGAGSNVPRPQVRHTRQQRELKQWLRNPPAPAQSPPIAARATARRSRWSRTRRPPCTSGWSRRSAMRRGRSRRRERSSGLGIPGDRRRHAHRAERAGSAACAAACATAGAGNGASGRFSPAAARPGRAAECPAGQTGRDPPGARPGNAGRQAPAFPGRTRADRARAGGAGRCRNPPARGYARGAGSRRRRSTCANGRTGCPPRWLSALMRWAKAGEAFAAGVDHLARARHLSAQIVAAAQSARAPVPASLTWQSLARRLGAMVGAALRPIASGHRRLGDLQWLDLPSARTPTEPIDWRSAETKATAADVAAITRSN